MATDGYELKYGPIAVFDVSPIKEMFVRFSELSQAVSALQNSKMAKQT